VARVDFYILTTPPGPETDRFACRLAARAFAAKHRVFVRVDDEARARALDELLWTFSDVSFVPHALAHTPEADEAPVVVGTRETPMPDASVTLNLSTSAVEPPPGVLRILEVVADAPDTVAAGRDRYRFYQGAGHTLETHKVGRDG